jgi:hypothetical protein
MKSRIYGLDLNLELWFGWWSIVPGLHTKLRVTKMTGKSIPDFRSVFKISKKKFFTWNKNFKKNSASMAELVGRD